MPNPATFLSFYKRRDIQEAIVESGINREIAVRFGEGFGKRPDVLKYPTEIIDLAKQGATSFHASEELWENPKLISADMKKHEIEKLRKGWDLVIDIDTVDWQLSKITAWLIIQSIKDFGIGAISVKFSGNKGFHIGVPFESFPEKYNNIETKNLFPEAPRKITAFLLEYISKKYIDVKSNNEIIFGDGMHRKLKINYHKLNEITGKSIDELTSKVCADCGRIIEKGKEERTIEFLCRICGSSIITKEDRQFEKCKKCNVLMEKIETNAGLCECGSSHILRKFNPFSVIEVDTILISPRHLFRMPYSLHEKSGLVSIPFNPEKILDFEKKYATPEIVKVTPRIFIDRKSAKKDEAKLLLDSAMHYGEEKERKESERSHVKKSPSSFEALEEAVPEVFFPPCIKKILNGLEDGKKRAVFILINFLKCLNWQYDMIEERIKEWNKKNPEHLKETIIIGQLRYHKRAEKILPPNCGNEMYYKSMQVCIPDSFCQKIKNPVNYAIIKQKIEKSNKKPQKKAKESRHIPM